jgi:mannose-6-phosphate isomerase-like protein (cupin superfamily)
VKQLAGGVLVAGLREGEPRRDGDLRIWNHFRGANVSLRAIEGRGTLRNDNADEVLFDLGTETGIYLPAHDELAVEGTYVGVAVPVEDSRPRLSVPLRDQPMQQTGDRFYRELIQAEVTQFVGSIPAGRAPDHFHLYEEVLCILEGRGTMWAGTTSTPIEPGSCVYLPRRQVHCVENCTAAYLRLLGVFYPAGSPAVRYGVHERAESGPDER